MAKAKVEIPEEIQDIINISIERAIKKSISTISEKQKKDELEKLDYFKLTEKLLYSYPRLKDSVSDVDSYFEEPGGKSKSIIVMSRGSGSLAADEEGYLRSRRASLERTKADIAWIERALRRVKGWPEYRVLELKYFEGLTFEEIAEVLDVEERTARRRRSKIVREISLYLFGSAALELST